MFVAWRDFFGGDFSPPFFGCHKNSFCDMLSPLPRATSDMREKADNDSKIVSLKALNQKYVLISPNLTMQGFIPQPNQALLAPKLVYFQFGFEIWGRSMRICLFSQNTVATNFRWVCSPVMFGRTLLSILVIQTGRSPFFTYDSSWLSCE